MQNQLEAVRKTFKPKRSTQTGLALQRAFKELHTTESQTDVIVITDGQQVLKLTL